uniref:Uncharacterized protein n=1 Tax=Arundo donax TaxID=35708 RepID=A0A0A9AQQ6_ARUDO
MMLTLIRRPLNQINCKTSTGV